MKIFRVDEYIEGRRTGRSWDVSALDMFEAVDSAWWMQFTSHAPRGDLVLVAIDRYDKPATDMQGGLVYEGEAGEIHTSGSR